jgi:NTE family protein
MVGNPGRSDRKPSGEIQSRRGWNARILRRRPTRLNLALQGGGAHGAFTWGVLAHLLEAGIRIEGISGASAGALNAVALAAGWLRGGAAGAVQALDELWREIGRLAQLNPLRAGGLTQMAADFAAQYLSPYQLNPLGANPLRAVLERLVDFERLRAVGMPRLFIAATSVATGRARIFGNSELSVDAVLASTCLPQLHPAITIDGQPYWDGGFSANPPLVALVEGSRARDLVLVQINPMVADRTPRTPSEIRNRIAEIAFGRPLVEELERLRHGASSFGPMAWLSTRRRRLRRHRLHTIDGSAELSRLDPRTKMDPTWPLLLDLRERGWRAAESWLHRNGGAPSTDRIPAAKLASEMHRRAG